MNDKNPSNEGSVDKCIDPPATDSGRWELIRDLVGFQFKLALDGLRDLLLSPVSIVIAMYGLFFGGDRPGKHFYSLLHWGHKTELSLT
jgi:hypothetical protein